MFVPLIVTTCNINTFFLVKKVILHFTIKLCKSYADLQKSALQKCVLEKLVFN